MSITRWIWRCKKCDDVVISYSHLKHDMNFCECGESAVDLEQEYCRTMGCVEFISIKEKTKRGWIKT